MPEFGSAKEAFEGIKGLDPSRTVGVNGTIQFDLAGEGGGQWALVLSDGSFEVVDGGVDDPTTTINMSAADYVKMMNGELNAMAAFMQGKIKMRGDMGLAMKLQTLIS
jgi:putative sterol carrier protein